MVQRNLPYNRTAVRTSAGASVVLLGLAGLFVYLVTPDVRFESYCGSGWNTLAVLGMFVAFLAGSMIFLLTLSPAVRSRSWTSAFVPLSGLCLFLCAVALGYLTDQAWPTEGCSD